MSDRAAHRLRLYSIGFTTGKTSFASVSPTIATERVRPSLTQLKGRATFSLCTELVLMKRATTSAGIWFLLKSNRIGEVSWAGSALGPMVGGKRYRTGAVVSWSLRRLLVWIMRWVEGADLLERGSGVCKIEFGEEEAVVGLMGRVPALGEEFEFWCKVSA